mmetsp:Transcript_15758/g.45027  ORF Transcript_15758/g.45027 Transcript_15758/m.45027 type:complete len:347 (+) Transcript_15758:350-1390(+)
MSLPHSLESLLRNDSERLSKTVPRGDHASVVVGAAPEPTPIVTNEVHIKIVRPHLGLPALELFDCTVAQEEWCRPWWRAEALLGATVDGVNLPVIGKDGHAAQGAHRVHKEQGAVLLTEIPDTGQRLLNTRGGLSLAQKEHGRLVSLYRLPEFLVAERLSSIRLELDDVGTKAVGHIGHTLPPDALVPNDDRLPWLHEVGDGCLHAGVARSAHRQRVLALGLKQVTQSLLDFVHDLQHRGVEVPEERLGLRQEDALVRIGRSRSHQVPLRNVDDSRRALAAVIDGMRRLVGTNGRGRVRGGAGSLQRGWMAGRRGGREHTPQGAQRRLFIESRRNLCGEHIQSTER